MLIEGPKWCGKTTTTEQFAGSILYMDDPEKIDQNIAMSQLSPKRLLKGATPRLIDEWQLAPKLWDAICFEVDHRGASEMLDKCFVIVISFHEQKFPITYYFR